MSDAKVPGASREAADALAAAEAAKFRAEALKADAERRRTELFARQTEIEVAKIEEAEIERRSSNKYRRIYVFEGMVDDDTVRDCIAELDVWRRIDPQCAVTIRFYSPGGDVIAGMYLFDYLTGMRRDGHQLTTEAYGYAASMAGILLQAGDRRVIGRESYILIHEIAFGVRGKIGEVEDEIEFVKKITDRVLDIFAARASEAQAAGTTNKALTRAQFKRRWTRKDWWMSSDEALKFGVVDEVA